MLFSYLLHCVLVTCNEIGLETCLFQCTELFLRFLHSLTKIVINYVMTNKMAWNERMSPFKRVYII